MVDQHFTFEKYYEFLWVMDTRRFSLPRNIILGQGEFSVPKWKAHDLLRKLGGSWTTNPNNVPHFLLRGNHDGRLRAHEICKDKNRDNQSRGLSKGVDILSEKEMVEFLISGKLPENFEHDQF